MDLVAAALNHQGIHRYLVEIGGELRGTGLKPDGQPWWAQVEPPLVPDLSNPCSMPDVLLALSGCAVATSGDYRRGFTAGGRWYSHTIDPRCGTPVTHRLASVTVVTDTCMRADAWSTPAMKAYVDGFPAAAVARDQLPYAKAELSTHDNQRVTQALNDGLQAALTGTKTPEQAMKDAQRESERLLRSYK